MYLLCKKSYIDNTIFTSRIKNVFQRFNIFKMASETTTNITTDYEQFISKNERIVYVGQVVYKQPRVYKKPRVEKSSENKWKGKWDIKYECSKDIQKKENGRIYLILVNNKIYKIGSSSSKGGIKATLGCYITGLGGSPSIRTMGIPVLIQELLDAGNEIKIYVLFNDPIKVPVYGLFSVREVDTYPQVKEMEEECRIDYKKIYGKYPQWNFQENHEKWPVHIQKLFTEQVNQRKKKDIIIEEETSTSVIEGDEDDGDNGET
jgi:hypothetical protein